MLVVGTVVFGHSGGGWVGGDGEKRRTADAVVP